jgi:hypothetical protein
MKQFIKTYFLKQDEETREQIMLSWDLDYNDNNVDDIDMARLMMAHDYSLHTEGSIRYAYVGTPDIVKNWERFVNNDPSAMYFNSKLERVA